MADKLQNGMREQLRQMSVEVQSLRETRHEHSGLLSVLGQQLKDALKTLDKLEEEQEGIDKRVDRLELQDKLTAQRRGIVNWWLVLVATGIMSLIIAIATRLIGGS